MVSKCDVMKYVGPSTSVLCQKFQEMQAVDSREISALVRGVNTEPEFGLTLMKNRIICAHIFAWVQVVPSPRNLVSSHSFAMETCRGGIR